MRGRKPLPDNVKILRGNPGKRPIPVRPHAPAPGLPEPPDHLTPEGRAEWDRLAPELHAVGLLSGRYRAAFALYCQTYARVVEAERVLAKQGAVLRSKQNTQMKNTWLTILRDERDALIKLCAEFGLTPSSIVRVMPIAQPRASDDPMEEFLKSNEA